MRASELADPIRPICRHAGLIQKIAYAYRRNAADREVVVQEVAVKLWRAHHRFDGRCKEPTWDYRIPLNVAISFHRREHRHRERRLDADVHALAIAAASESEPPEDVRLVLHCIDNLGSLDKALVLLYLDGNDHASIADVLGISVSNVGTKLGRISDRLRAAFERRGQSDRMEGSHGTR
ncbi:MAG: RNA polymerase sigma factor [Planctomycetes bacterium]|nr:RNA polymerase sigma factor [Planctomycetota bacterium]